MNSNFNRKTTRTTACQPSASDLDGCLNRHSLIDDTSASFYILSSMLKEDSITQLKGSLRGRLIQPGDAHYDEARKVYNGMIHKKPRLIAQCADVADVMSCVNFARDND